jgi:hypothetical protein
MSRKMTSMPRIPTEFVKIVAFLCSKELSDKGEPTIVPRATAFFVRVPIGDAFGKATMDYLVTANHVLEEARAEETDTIFLRINRIEGSFDVPTSIDDWLAHDSADVAALLMSPDDLPKGITSKDLGQASIALRSALDQNYRYAGPTDLGDVDFTIDLGYDVYLTGLFSDPNVEPGYLPIARFGHVSRMPTTVEIESGKTKRKVLAYLMEFQSWGGYSGAPVFFIHPILVETIKADGAMIDTGWVVGLAGLVSGHFGILGEQKQQSGEVVRYQMNAGIAIVTPSHSIAELLLRADVVEERLERAKAITQKYGSTT